MKKLIDYHVGFTGTQAGMTGQQFSGVAKVVKSLVHSHTKIHIHHGDCIGADEDMHRIAGGQGFDIIIHPPIKGSKRAYCDTTYPYSAVILSPKDYLVRNKDIVNACSILMATPKEKDEQKRSGTWSTIRYAKKTGTPVYIVFPDGTIDYWTPSNTLDKFID